MTRGFFVSSPFAGAPNKPIAFRLQENLWLGYGCIGRIGGCIKVRILRSGRMVHGMNLCRLQSLEGP